MINDIFCKVGSFAPQTTRKCAFHDPVPAAMKEGIAKWEALHKEMIDLAKSLIPQGAPAKEGLRRIDELEEELVKSHNAAIDAYNKYIRLTPDQLEVLKYAKPSPPSGLKSYAEIERAFRAIPTIWY